MDKENYMDKEIWKIYRITYWKNYSVRHTYEISNLGRVKVDGKIHEFGPISDKVYYHIGQFHVHRAVAELFIPNPENKPEVDHINTDRHDNRAENLRWVTKKENANNTLSKINCSNAQKGKVLSEDTKRKIGLAVKGRPGGFTGGHHSEEAKKKIGLALKGRHLSEETKKKMSASKSKVKTKFKHWKVVNGKRVWY